MNKFIYELENNAIETNIEEDSEINSTVYLNTLNSRKVWIIKLEHNREEKNNGKLTDKDKLYFIDITTGEIIGGQYTEKS